MRYNEIITESKKASPQAIQAVLNWFKKNIEEHHEDIEYTVDTGEFDSVDLQTLGISNLEDQEAIQKMNDKQLSHAFKAHFGISDKKFLEKCENEHDASVDPRVLQLTSLISSVTTTRCRIKPNGMLDGISFYMYSPKKMVVNNFSCQGVIIATELEAIGWTFQAAATFMKEHGAEQLKRPSQPKAGRYSMYD